MSATETALALTPAQIALVAAEAILLLTGTVLLLRKLTKVRERLSGRLPVALEWSAYNVTEVILTAAYTLGGGVLLQLAATQAGAKWFPPASDGSMGLFHVVASGAFQIGMLAGLAHAWFWHLRPRQKETLADYPIEPTSPRRPEPGLPPDTTRRAIARGALAFVTLLPLVWATSFAWQALLPLFGVEPEAQELVTLFANSGDLPALACMIVLAVIIAPLTEETLFRIGLFRWLRSRTPRAIALLVPALTFAAMHGSLSVFLPLAVLAIGLALAYERGGHPLTPIITHSLFNLHTIVLLLAGFPS